MDIKKQRVGTEDFEKNILSNSVYIDKTSYLTDLYGEHVHSNGMSYTDEVLLFTRPRRFGKSLTMNMIRNFFEINYANPDDKSKPVELFKNLAISKNKDFCNKYMGEYPVILLSLKGIDGKTYEKALQKFLQRIGDLYRTFRPFFEGSEKQYQEDMKFFNEVLELSNSTKLILTDENVITNIENAIITSLYKLTAMLNTEYGKKTIVMVDEYDVPLQKATVEKYYDEMLDVVRGMFEKVFKTNEYLEKGFVTGCLRISHESIFTGINNFSIYTVNDEAYNKFIGFTHKETLQLLKDNQLLSRKDDVMAWYDGYNFAGARMLCPWSVLKFCEGAGASSNPGTFAPQNYWINTSGNDIIKICITKPNAKDSLRLQNLLDGNTETVKPTDFTAYPEINYQTGFDVMMGMMIHTGYLTVLNTDEKGAMEVKIPNHEIKDSFRKCIDAIFSSDNPTWSEKAKDLKKSLFKNDRDKVQQLINELLINFVSVRDTAYESFYQGFLTGVISITIDQDSEELLSNSENGLGFADTIIDNTIESKVVIIEYKKAEKGESFKEICSEALKQIEEKQYSHKYEQKNYSIYKYGITFSGKNCWVATPGQ